MEYKFKGIDGKGKVIKGKVYEESQWQAINNLSKQGISCIWCKAEGDKRGEFLGRKISYKDLSLLCRTLKNNLKSGIPIITTLKLTTKHMKKKRLTMALRNLLVIIEGGGTLTEALSKSGSSFPRIFISMVTIGEESGKLEEIFGRLEIYFSREDKRRKTVKNIMIYPMLIFVASALGAYVIITKLMPTFIYNMNVEENKLPSITKFYMALGEILQKFDFMILPLILLVTIIIIYLSKRYGVDEYMDKFKYSSIFTKGIYIKNFGCRFTMALHMVISCGIDIKNAFHLLERSETSNYIKKKYREAVKELEKGSVLSEVINSFQLFPEEFLVSIILGEESGALDEVLHRYNEIFEEDLKNKIDMFIKLLEPALMLLAGVFLFSVYVAVLMPIYSIYSS